MNRTPLAAHAAHDELLIARLFGGDVSDVEREHALELMGECGECAALFADLGDIADATEALPVPARPRDFSLTQTDVARLSRRRWGRPIFVRTGLRRSLGGSLAALGVVGLMLTATTSLFGGAVGVDLSPGLSAAQRAAVPNAVDNGAAAATAAPASSLAAALPAAPTGGPLAVSSPDSVVALGSAEAPDSSVDDVPGAVEPASSSVADVQFGATGAGPGSAPGQDSGQNGEGAFDARLVWLAGFGILFAVGLAIMLIPWLSRRRGLRQ
jgi:hypothetical protein